MLFSVFHWRVTKDRCTGALSSWKNQRFPPKYLYTTGHKFSSNISIYFCESICPSIGTNVPTPKYDMQPQNITDLLRFLPLPRHSGRQASVALLQTQTLLFWPITTCVLSEKITDCQSLLTVQPSFCRHQETRQTLLALLITTDFQIFLLVKPQERRRRLTVRGANDCGMKLLSVLVISCKVCFPWHLTWRMIRRSHLSSVFFGLPLRCKFSTLLRHFHRFRNFDIQDWLTFNTPAKCYVLSRKLLFSQIN